MQSETIFWFGIFQHGEKWCQQAVVDNQRNVKASQRMKSEDWNTLKRIVRQGTVAAKHGRIPNCNPRC